LTKPKPKTKGNPKFMDSAGGPFLAGEQIMQINKQNRNMNIYGYDILIGRDADSTRGILGFLGL